MAGLKVSRDSAGAFAQPQANNCMLARLSASSVSSLRDLVLMLDVLQNIQLPTSDDTTAIKKYASEMEGLKKKVRRRK